MGLGSLRLARLTLGLCNSKGSFLFLGKRSEGLTDLSWCIEISRWRLGLLFCDHEVIVCTSTSPMMGKRGLCADRLPLWHGGLWRLLALSCYWCVWIDFILSSPAPKSSSCPPAAHIVPRFNFLSDSIFTRWLFLSRLTHHLLGRWLLRTCREAQGVTLPMIAILRKENGILLLLEITDKSIVLLASRDLCAASAARAKNLIRTDACKVDLRRSSRYHYYLILILLYSKISH